MCLLMEERRRVRRGWPPENSGWTVAFQVEGPAGCALADAVLAGPEYSRGGRGPLP